jgi:hypothetical protein
MIQLNNYDQSYIEQFVEYSTFEEWKNEEVDEDDENMNKNIIDLAKIFYRWLENGDIKCLYVKDDEEDTTVSGSKTP